MWCAEAVEHALAGFARVADAAERRRIIAALPPAVGIRFLFAVPPPSAAAPFFLPPELWGEIARYLPLTEQVALAALGEQPRGGAFIFPAAFRPTVAEFRAATQAAGNDVGLLAAIARRLPRRFEKLWPLVFCDKLEARHGAAARWAYGHGFARMRYPYTVRWALCDAADIKWLLRSSLRAQTFWLVDVHVEACKAGRVDILRFLFSEFSAYCFEPDAMWRAFRAASEKICIWLMRRVKMSQPASAFASMCVRGFLDAARLAARPANYGKKHLKNIWPALAKTNHVAVAEWLAERYGCAAEAVGAEGRELLRLAHRHNRLEMALCLRRRFGVPPGDVEEIVFSRDYRPDWVAAFALGGAGESAALALLARPILPNAAALLRPLLARLGAALNVEKLLELQLAYFARDSRETFRLNPCPELAQLLMSIDHPTRRLEHLNVAAFYCAQDNAQSGEINYIERLDERYRFTDREARESKLGLLMGRFAPNVCAWAIRRFRQALAADGVIERMMLVVFENASAVELLKQVEAEGVDVRSHLNSYLGWWPAERLSERDCQRLAAMLSDAEHSEALVRLFDMACRSNRVQLADALARRGPVAALADLGLKPFAVSAEMSQMLVERFGAHRAPPVSEKRHLFASAVQSRSAVEWILKNYSFTGAELLKDIQIFLCTRGRGRWPEWHALGEELIERFGLFELSELEWW